MCNGKKEVLVELTMEQIEEAGQALGRPLKMLFTRSGLQWLILWRVRGAREQEKTLRTAGRVPTLRLLGREMEGATSGVDGVL